MDVVGLPGLLTTCVIDGTATLGLGAADNPSLRVDCPGHPYSVCHGYPLDLGCDANDPHRLADFWAQALGYVREPGYDDPDGACIVEPEGKSAAIGWLRVPEGKSAKNSLHIDIGVAGEGPWDLARRERPIRAKVPEVVARGATVVREECWTLKAMSSAWQERPSLSELNSQETTNSHSPGNASR